MEDPDGVEAASEWQCAESGWPKSAPGEHEQLTSPDFDHPKTYITSKQIKIKALKSKLKQVIK